MRGNFEKAYAVERRYEGGNVNHPRDPGGRTSRGVIQRVYDGYRKRAGLPTRDVWKASESEVKDIYRIQYWDVIRGNELPSGIDLVVFDGAVNSGPSQSVKWLQRALGVHADGQIGQVTLSVLDQAEDHDAVIENICAQRMRFLRNLKTWGTFGKGWSARVNNLKEIGQAWAKGSVGPQPISVSDDGGNQPAPASDIAEPVASPETAGAATGAGGLVTGTLMQVQQQLQEHAGTVKIIGYVSLALTIIIAGYTIYSFWRRSKIKEAMA